MRKPKVIGPIKTPHGDIYLTERVEKLRKSQRSTLRRQRFEFNRTMRKRYDRLRKALNSAAWAL